jgi:DNA-binding MarR family transcriptional regulator
MNYSNSLPSNGLAPNKMEISNYFSRSPVFQLIRAGRDLERLVNAAIKDCGVSYFQALLLVALHVESAKKLTLMELLKVFPLTKGALSQSVSLLETAKLIEREPARDRRRSWIHVTPKGAQLALKLIALLEKQEQRFDAVAGSELLRAVDQAVRKIR